MHPIRPNDVFRLQADFWPGVTLYSRQVEIIRSALTRRETHVPAGNKLGKDFVAGLLALSCFVLCEAKGITCRIVTTSVAGHHLAVLWGEVGRFITTASAPLLHEKGGTLVLNHQELRRASEREARNPLNYVVGLVSAKGEGLAGHHADFTMLIGDESSSLDDQVHEMGQGWAKHMLFLGNPNPCQNFWRKACQELKAVPGGCDGERARIQVRAEDSPNVVHRRTVWPGVLSWEEYQYRRKHWEVQRQCVGLDAEFYEGAEVLMFPPAWLNASAARAAELTRPGKGLPRAIGCDPGEGGAETCWVVADLLGVLDVVALKTPDTAVIPARTVALMRQHDVPPERVIFDRGGGGQQHADALRRQGLPVRTVGFGEAVTPDPRHGRTRLAERRAQREERYAYFNMRACLYGQLRQALDPGREDGGAVFAIPAKYAELRRQLAPVPLTFDAEGRLKLLPKNRRQGSKERCMADIVGCSPDQSDALCLAYHALLHKGSRVRAGAF